MTESEHYLYLHGNHKLCEQSPYEADEQIYSLTGRSAFK